MTSPLRRKRLTIALARRRLTPTLARLALAACWLTAGLAAAQERKIRIVNHQDLVPHAAQGQVRNPPGAAARDDALPYSIQFDLPGPNRVFQLDSEDDLFQRMKQETRERRPEELVFPDKPVLTKEPYFGRNWPSRKMLVEPHFVCHKRLHFEHVNSERFGWELGVFQPLVSTAQFYRDVAMFPMHAFSYPRRCYDCSAGKCLPGDPVPLYLYPPEFTLTGTAAEGLSIAALLAIFP